MLTHYEEFHHLLGSINLFGISITLEVYLGSSLFPTFRASALCFSSKSNLALQFLLLIRGLHLGIRCLYFCS